MSLLHRVKEGIKQRYEKGKQEKKERKTIDREAQAKAHQEYLKAYRQERMKAVTSSVRAKAKRDASGGSRLGSAKPTLNFLSGAGQNLLKGDAFDVSFHNLGIPGFEQKPKTAPKQRIIGEGSKSGGTTITVDGKTIHISGTTRKKTHAVHVQKKKKPVKIFNPLDF